MTADRYVPSSEDRFSCGIWTVGWPGADASRGTARPPMPAARAVYKLAEPGVHGVSVRDSFVAGAEPVVDGGMSQT